MPYIETVNELAEAIANMIGIYGTNKCACGCGDDEQDDHADKCSCRSCFVGGIEQRIRQAVGNDEKLRKMWVG